MKALPFFPFRRALILVSLGMMQLPLFAQSPTVEMKLRVMPVDGPTRRTDNNFQMAGTSGLSVAQVNGTYYLYGPNGAYDGAWAPSGTAGDDLRFPGGAGGWCSVSNVQAGVNTPPCDPGLQPTQRDKRCGDVAGRLWKGVNSSVTSWLYDNSSTGIATRIPGFAAVGSWPVQNNPIPPPNAQGVCQLATGIPGWLPSISAAAINAAIPNPPPLASPGNCTRDTTAHSFATGAADSKVVNINGKWYMAFSETVNNPQAGAIGIPPNHYGWTAADVFLVGWATSSDGINWTIRHQLFHTSLEQTVCNAVLLVTELITDNGFFYMLAGEAGGKGLMLFRAPIDTANPDGFDNNAWQLETQNSSGVIGWTSVATGSLINTSNVNGSGVQAVSVAPVPAFVQQGALQRVFNSSAANSPSQIVLIATEDTANGPILDVWTAPDFGQAFTKQSTVDTTFIKPIGFNGWEFGFTYFPDQTAATPRIIGNEFDFWLVGNVAPGGTPDPTATQILTGYRTTATLSGSIYSPRAALRTSGGNYLSVTAGMVNATQTSIGVAARFVVLDPHVNVVQSGDTVNLQARNGNYISATGGGGSSAVAVAGQPGTNETFTIVKVNGMGPIVNGDPVAFRSSGGYYLVAENGGGGTVDFPMKTITAPSTFIYTSQ